MIHSLPLPIARITPPAGRPLPLSVAGPWRPTLIWIAGIAVCLLGALASLPRSAWADEPSPGPSDAAPAASAASTAPVPSRLAARAKARCSTCGVVEAIRSVQPVGAQSVAYEFTVRLRDGSARVSTVSGATASAWAVGDSIMLIGGI